MTKPCHVPVLKRSPENGEASRFEYTLKGHLSKVQSNLYSQWLDGNFCDIKLHTIDGCIDAHACMLAAFSPKLATILDTSGAVSLDIMFKHSIVKIIVEAVYSGLFSAAVGQIDELLTALQWFDMNELVEVVRFIQDKAEKENLVISTHDEIPDISKPRPRKRLRKKRRQTCFTKGEVSNAGPDSIHVAMSLVNNMPVVLTVNQKDKELLPDTVRNKDKVNNDDVEGTAKESLNLSIPKEEPPQDAEVNNINLKCNDHLVGTHERALQPEHTCQPFEDNSASPSGNVSAESNKDLRSKDRNKSKKKYKAGRKSGRQRKSPRAETSKRREPKRSKRKGRQAERASSIASDGNIREGEADKERDATEALMTIGDTVIKQEPPELEECEPDESLEIERAFLEGHVQYVTCYRCQAAFSSVEEYKSHVENHPTFTCENCFSVFYSRSLLSRHFRKEHLKSMHLKCSHCDFTATDDKKFEQHCVEEHQELQPFKCLFEGCEFTTSKYRYLARHFGKHDQIRTFKCVKCQKPYNDRGKWDSHQRSCLQLRKYLCDICGRSFNHPASMQIHRRSMHFGERPYTCEVCQKSFSNGANLRRHLRIHNNTFPYSCTACGKKFRHSNTLKLHLSKHKKIPESNPDVLESGSDTTTMSPPKKPSTCRRTRRPFASNSTIQLESAPSVPSSTDSPVLSMATPSNDSGALDSQAMPLSQNMATVVNSACSVQAAFPAFMSVSHDPTADFLQYHSQLQWHAAGRYPHPNL